MRFTFQDLPSDSAERFHGIAIERIDRGGKPIAKVWQGKQGKPFAHFCFRDEAHRERYIEEQKAAELRRIEYKEKQRADKARAAAEMVNPFQVGDIVYNSWGWEQTNVDFYQVVAVTAKSIKIRSIAQTGSDKPTGNGMAEYVLPVKDQFLPKGSHEARYREGNPPITKTLKAYLNKKEEVEVYIHWKFGGGGKWHGQPVYSSWYA